MTSEEKAYLDEQFGAIREQFAAVDRRLDKMDERFDRMDQRFDAVDKRFEDMVTRIDGVEIGLSGEIHALGVNMEDRHQNVTLLAEPFSTLQRITNDKIDNLRTELLDQIVPIGLAVRHHFEQR